MIDDSRRVATLIYMFSVLVAVLGPSVKEKQKKRSVLLHEFVDCKWDGNRRVVE